MRRVADPQATPVGNLPVRPGLAGFISERWPASNRYAWPECVGIRNAATSQGTAIEWGIAVITALVLVILLRRYGKRRRRKLLADHAEEKERHEKM